MNSWKDEVKELLSFNDLKRASLTEVQGVEHRIAVLGDCATQLLSVAIQGHGRIRGLNLKVVDGEYAQIEAQLLDQASEVMSSDPELLLIWLSTPVLYEEFLRTATVGRTGFADQILARMIRYWDIATRQQESIRIIVPNFPEIDDKVLGNYSSKVEITFVYQIRKLNYLIQEEIAKRENIYPVDLIAINRQMGQAQYFNADLYYTSRMAASVDAQSLIAGEIVSVISSIYGRIKKCLVCDLDNTLWGGVIADDGIDGIEIGELGEGRAYSDLQLWLKQLKECGIMLAACSKNDESVAKEAFIAVDEMVLKLSDFVMFVANWEDKASNIRYIQDVLNIGMDSIVFLDDNPFERNLVRQLLPEVVVPELPEDPALRLSYLQRENLFEVASYAQEGVDRTRQYQAEAERQAVMRNSGSVEEYLAGLQMQGCCYECSEGCYSRVAQLTQRSNQFNLRTVRYSADDIRRMTESEEYMVLCCNLRDRFGDNGLVSVVILRMMTEDQAFIDTWIMSCRVLKRGMEDFVMNEVVCKATSRGINELIAEYIPTAKNSMVKDIYDRMGYEAEGNGRYRLRTERFERLSTYIQILPEDSGL